ncbi:MAG: bifunctional folylpolyglutamate synthase/dihydrofolate synthase, partial [Chitinophagaceae bacterium]
LNGEMISQDFVIDFTERMKEEANAIEPSFFEITVAMAYDYFAREKVDIAIIETGLGGRLDSSNIITPELSVITNIGMDHMNLLGDTLEQIAGEKAGIIKEGIPVVIGETLPETGPVFERVAREKKAPLFPAYHHRSVTGRHWENNNLELIIRDERTGTDCKYLLDLPGIYQTKNTLTVLEACERLQQAGWRISENEILTGLSQVKKLTGLRGRWEIIRNSPKVVIDVAHNEDGIRQLGEQITQTPHEGLHIIIGLVKDKDPERVLRELPANAVYYFTRAQIPRALPEDELMKKAEAAGLKGKSYSTVNTALYAASLAAGKNDLIVVCGSIFLAGEISGDTLKAIWGKDEYSTEWLNILEIFGEAI